MSDSDARLAQRGIAHAARAMGWTPGPRGWTYPVFDTSGQRVALRFKNYDSSASPKYTWAEGKATFYHAPDVLDAISEAGGALVIANGEPGVLTFHEAGVRNVLALFGEGTIPRDAAATFKAWGVTRVSYYPDQDDPGRMAARRWHDALEKVGITFTALDLAGAGLTAKGADTNDLWQAAQFDPAAFAAALASLPLATLPPSPDRKPAQHVARRHDDLPDEFVRAVMTDLERRAVRTVSGGQWRMLSPFRDESDPSFDFNPAKGLAIDRATGQGYNLLQIGRHLGYDVRDFVRDAAPAPAPRRDAQRQAAPAVQLPTFTPDETVDVRYLTELNASEYLNPPALLIKSPTGTGKTSFVASWCKAFEARHGRGPRVLVISHRQALTRDHAQRLSTETGLAFEHYRRMNRSDIPRAMRMVICYDSLPKLVGKQGDALPEYDLVVIDELQQFHAHLDAGTMQGGQAARCWATLNAVVARARHFIGLDAHLTDASRRWIEGVKGDVWALENTHQHDRGALTWHADETTLINEALATAQRASAPVLVACASKEQAKLLGMLFAAQLGDAAVRLVHGDNSEDADTQAFIADINAQLGQYRAVIYTTSLGTGVDITAPVAGAFGLFGRVNGLTAYDFHQMLARARHAACYHAFVRDEEGQRPTDAAKIYSAYERKARMTGLACQFDAEGIEHLTPQIESAARLLAEIKAERNAAQNAPHATFEALAGGYRLKRRGGRHGDMAERLKAARKELKEATRRAILAAPIVSDDALNEARETGALTSELRDGNAAWHILETVGRDALTEELYDDLYRPEQRQALRAFADLDAPRDELVARDRWEAQNDVLLSKRGHFTITRQLILDALIAVWGARWRGGAEKDEALTAAQIEERFAAFLAMPGRCDDLRDLLGRRAGQSESPLALLRFILARVGLRLDRRQVMRKGERFYVYVLDGVTLAKMDDYAASRRAHLARRRAERAAQPATKNYFKPVYIDSTPERSGWTPAEIASRRASFAALTGALR